MKEEIKNIWVKALRSGDYQQGEGMLVNDGKFCCLGVLCDLHRHETDSAAWKTAGDENDTVLQYTPLDSAIASQREAGVLPPFVMKWSGVRTPQGTINNGSLTALNDSGSSFSEIADYIDENWKTL